jgi:DNA repair exonuclease SbcCD nuclease subunit
MAKTIREEKAKTLLICGDLTDKKDRHPSELVNRTVRVIRDLQRDCPGVEIVILTGNHDWLKGGEEYFRFLNSLEGVRFITEPREDEKDVKGPSALFLPFTKNPLKDWAGIDFQHFDYVFMHQTVKGSITSNGQAIERGDELPNLRDAGKVYSGDIHVPQVMSTPWGKIEYIGSPYHVHFGDDFQPRAILLEKGGRAVDLHFKSIRRVSAKVKGVDDLCMSAIFWGPGDQVKVTVKLTEAEKHEWSRIRRECGEVLKRAKVEVHGLSLEVEKSERRTHNEVARTKHSPEQAVLSHVEAEALTPDAFDAAMEVIEQ